MKIEVSVSLSNAVKVIPNDAIYLYVLHDFTRTGLSRPSLNGAPRTSPGLPETCPLYGDFVRLTEEKQWWWYDICIESSGLNRATNGNQFAGLTSNDRYITNRYGSNTNACYPAGQNTSAEDMRYFPLVTGGTVLKALDSSPVNVFGGSHWRIQTIGDTESVGLYHPSKEWWLFSRPTVSDREEVWNEKGTQWTGYYIEDIVELFHWFDYKSIVPIWTRATHWPDGTDKNNGGRFNFIPADRVIPLVAGRRIPSTIELFAG